MFRRTFADNAPHIVFTRSWEQWATGNFVPGQTVLISYDPGRLGYEPSIEAFYRFSSGGPIETRQLDAPTGQVVPRFSDDPVEATMMTAAIAIPEDAEELILWFAGGGNWDSNFDRNYVFRFTSIDIQGQNATVAGDRFEVSITALPVVESVAVHFQVINIPGAPPGSVPLAPGNIENGRRAWSAAGIAVPPGANVFFTFSYTVEGRTFVEDNDRTGFYAPKPLPTYNPAKYAAALKK